MCKTLPAFTVDKHIARFHVAMNNIARMDEIRCVQELIHYVSFVYILQYRSTFDHIMQIAFHKFKWQINIHVIRCSSNKRYTKKWNIFVTVTTACLRRIRNFLVACYYFLHKTIVGKTRQSPTIYLWMLNNCTMFGWFRKARRNMISLNVRWASVSLRNASNIFLTATVSWVFLSIAFHTIPYAPLPKRFKWKF